MPDAQLYWPQFGAVLVEVHRYYRVPFGLCVLATTASGKKVLAPASDLVVIQP